MKISFLVASMFCHIDPTRFFYCFELHSLKLHGVNLDLTNLYLTKNSA